MSVLVLSQECKERQLLMGDCYVYSRGPFRKR